ncbi:MAG: bile acid:sodium symporter family protein [Cyanobacteria bacterium]|nr:bile acid:sodium symporter family protein [Cyanobacteriota bacterium]
MESSVLTAVLLPLALFVIMLGMGLGLTVADFKRVVVEPRAMVLGLVAQLVMLPLVGLGLAIAFPLSSELAVGVMVLAACPGGPTSNLISYLVGGNVALSISLTAISSLITVFTIPLVVNGAMQVFMGSGTSLQLPFATTVLQIAVITLIPVGLGMVLHRFRPRLAAQLESGVKWLSLGFLGLIIAGLLVQERANVVSFFVQVGLVALTLNLVTMALGYGIGRWGRLPEPSVRAITVEVGIQNGTLAIAVASAPTLLNMPTLAIPAAIYSLLMFATSALFAIWVRQTSQRGSA